jgi:hypothetical protein
MTIKYEEHKQLCPNCRKSFVTKIANDSEPEFNLCPACGSEHPFADFKVDPNKPQEEFSLRKDTPIEASKRVTGARHIADAVEAADKLDASRRKYNKSAKRLRAQKKYRESPLGQATWERYVKTEKFKLSVKKWRNSDKGQEYLKSRLEEEEQFKKIRIWLTENPGKTPQDYFDQNRS